MIQESRKKYLLKNTLIFSIGNFGSKIITFLLIPFYTNVFSTSEYGIVDLMTILSLVIIPIITLNISEAIMRFSMDNEYKKGNILKIGLYIYIISFILSILFIPLFYLLPIFKNYSILLVLYILTLSASSILMCYIRGIEKLLDYSLISIVQTLLIACLNILFLLVFKFGIYGYICSYIIAYVITIIICLVRGNIIKTLRNSIFEKNLFKQMINYSLLLIPNSLMWWIIGSLDRVMVSKMIGVAENGIYAISYKIPTIMITITTIFNQAWMFSAVREKDSKDKNKYTNDIFNALYTCVITVSGLLIVILKPLLSIYVGQAFFEAWRYTSPLLLGTIFLTLGTFLSNEYTANKDSKGFLKSSSLGATINIILNLVLIPTIGVLGAAIATCISYIAVFIFRVYDTRKYVIINFFNLKRTISVILLTILAIVIYFDNKKIYILTLIIYLSILFINRRFYYDIVNSLLKRGEKQNEK